MKRSAWFVRSSFAVALVAATALSVSCRNRSGDDGRGSSSGGPDVDAGAFDKKALLGAFGECALGTYREFVSVARELDAAARAAEADPQKRADAQASWRKAMKVWQRAELFQFGPAAMTGAAGARDMRDGIYAWPLVGRCQIEQTLADEVYEIPDFASLSLVSTRSLAALEYLLFYGGVDNACPATDALNAQGKWAALGEPEIQKRKAAYARVVAADVLARAERLEAAWDPAKENFLATFRDAPNATFVTQQMAFNAVSDAMFYLDIQGKNLKVGKPAGLLPECGKASCPEAVESPWAASSKDNLRANLDGYEKLLRGCGPDYGGLGVDDLLVAVGAEEVSTKLIGTVVAMRGALDALREPTLEEDIAKNPAGVKALFDAMRGNASVMKAELATVLDLEMPKPVVGDND